MAFDSVRHVTVLFGGEFPARGDTWEWDGSDWVRRVADDPQSYFQAGAYDSARRRTVLFSGPSASDSYLETWEWDGLGWTAHNTNEVSPRYWPAMAFDAARGLSVLFGGLNGETNDVAADDDYNFLADTWQWDGAAWMLRATTGPPGRSSHALSYDSGRGVIVLFGGWSHDGVGFVPLGDTWEWDGTQWTWRSESGPAPRYWHTLAYDDSRGVTVLFGGSTGTEHLGDTWEWDGSTWSLRSVTGPAARAFHTMANDGSRQVTVLWGGRSFGSNYVRYDDTWEWDGADWIRQLVVGPDPGQSSCVMVYDADRQVMLLTNPFAAWGEFWEYGYDKGACCDLLTGSCAEDILSSACSGTQQAWTGGAACIDVTCDAVIGACCELLSGSCTEDVYSSACSGTQQVWTGGAACVDVVCDAVTGACCDVLSGSCAEDMPTSACSGTHHAWTKGAICAEVVCDAVTGACCDHDPFGGACTDSLTQAECDCPSCEWLKLGSCSEVDCPHTAIPTVSEWGLVVLALLLLTGAKLAFRRPNPLDPRRP